MLPHREFIWLVEIQTQVLMIGGQEAFYRLRDRETERQRDRETETHTGLGRALNADKNLFSG